MEDEREVIEGEFVEPEISPTDKEFILTAIAEHLLDTCHYLENMNAYLMGKMSLSELRLSMKNMRDPVAHTPDAIKAWLQRIEWMFEEEVNDIDLSYMLGLTLEDIAKAKKEIREG